MDPTLIESGRPANKGKLLSGGTVALVIHAAVIGGIVHATLGARRADSGVRADTTLVFLEALPQRPTPPVPPPALEVPLKGFQTVAVPVMIPTTIPPINLQDRFDPKDFSGVGVEGGRADGVTPAPPPNDQVYSESGVDEQPLLVSAPPPPYPEVVKQARIQGRVVVQAIVDTTGHAEPGSIKILNSPSRGFDAPVTQWMQAALFRPARIDGHAVRVRVNLPVDYSLKGGS